MADIKRWLLIVNGSIEDEFPTREEAEDAALKEVDYSTREANSGGFGFDEESIRVAEVVTDYQLRPMASPPEDIEVENPHEWKETYRRG